MPAVCGWRQLQRADGRGRSHRSGAGAPSNFNTARGCCRSRLWLCCWPWGRASLLSLARVVLTVLKDLTPADGGTEGEEDASGDASVKSKCS